MAEYIDKQALITEIQSSVSMVLQTAPYEKVWFDRFVDRQNEIMAIIERQPTAEVEPVRHGHWIDCDNDAESMSLLLAQAPTVDAVEVVRCKDCVYFKTLPEDDYNICLHAEKGIVCPEPTDFCSYGERKEG